MTSGRRWAFEKTVRKFIIDVTGDGDDDFIVTLAGADYTPGAVVSAAGGA